MTPTPPPPTPTEGQRTLQKAADTWAASINERKWTDLHQLHPRTFRDKCTEAEFEEYAPHLKSVPGYPKVPKDTRVNIQGISADGTNGEVRYHLRRNGQEIGGSAAAITLQHDGDRWALTLPREILGQDQPCNMDNYLTRGKDRPHPAGSSVHGTDGALITVTNIDANAWDTIQKENSWNDSPDRGKRLIIVRIKVVNASGAGGIDVDERYFELTGSTGKLYTTYSDSCGVYPDWIKGILYPGEMLEGNVCFSTGTRETDLVLVHNPEWSGRKTYLALGPDGDSRE